MGFFVARVKQLTVSFNNFETIKFSEEPDAKDRGADRRRGLGVAEVEPSYLAVDVSVVVVGYKFLISFEIVLCRNGAPVREVRRQALVLSIGSGVIHFLSHMSLDGASPFRPLQTGRQLGVSTRLYCTDTKPGACAFLPACILVLCGSPSSLVEQD